MNSALLKEAAALGVVSAVVRDVRQLREEIQSLALPRFDEALFLIALDEAEDRAHELVTELSGTLRSL